ncbi:MAG: D-lyxose/D-mannose family sugar isomerase [Spirochaetales bacterium]|nr:MAG: D-lyxose/D-mannose family sugar isomerase [Spirochaetales bacterium]
MKRSEINNIMKESLAFLQEMNFLLPPFATWTPEEWKRKGLECGEIVESQLGWDITDFGRGDYTKYGLFMFTIRNSTIEELKKENGKIYAEKILIVDEEQITLTHFHYQKMEDIINRGGSDLIIQLWNSTPDEKLATTDVTVSVDGVRTTVKAADTITLTPGESVNLPQRLYHKFWGKRGKGKILVGEVSGVNDDYVDNHFYDEAGRFPKIEEDEPPFYLLYDDYKDYYKHA